MTTSIDPQLQAAAVQAINGGLAGIGPTASLVAIDNRTGEVKAMVGGNDFEHHPFNIATDGHRQPGSAFKPFTLIEALEQGIAPTSVWPSAPVTFKVSKRESFPVHNFEDKYSGSISLANALAYSDNTVFARVGVQVGTHKIARLANRMGLKTKVSTNLAITLGALKEGVNPLEMAYAYSTIANGGKRVTGSLPAWKNGPVAIEDVKTGDGKRVIAKDKRRFIQVVPTSIAQEAIQLMHGVVTHGTGTKANLPNDFVAGKTGTTENYGDAWFVGFDSRYTVAVWVGYPDKLIPMKTLYQGGPVEGGTYPAIIWHNFMVSALNILNTRNPKKNPLHYTPTGAPVGATGLASPSSGTSAPSQTQGTSQGKKKQQTQQNQQPQDNGERQRHRRSGHAGARHRHATDPAAAAHPRQQHRRGGHRRRGDGHRHRHANGHRNAHAGPVIRQRATPRMLGGQGRETERLRGSAKRQGSSTALVMPTRSPTARVSGRSPSPGGSSSMGPSPSSELPFSSRPIPSACVSLPGPEQSWWMSSRWRRSRIRSTPSTGSSALIRTAAPTPSGSQTAFRSAWMPYER